MYDSTAQKSAIFVSTLRHISTTHIYACNHALPMEDKILTYYLIVQVCILFWVPDKRFHLWGFLSHQLGQSYHGNLSIEAAALMGKENAL